MQYKIDYINRTIIIFILRIVKGFAPECKDASFVESSPKIQQAFLDPLNKHRNEIALGKVAHYDAAERMATVSWDDDLKDLADLKARTCKKDHDQCRNTGKRVK